MLACVDVDYRPDGSAAAACLVFPDWASDVVAASHVAWIDDVEPYRPGAFYRRELPCLVRVLGEVAVPLDVVIVDGYVTLDAAGAPGLGARLHDALGGKTTVVGVANFVFATATAAVPVLRGRSRAPLWVSAAGIDPNAAATRVQAMAGAHRIPDLLRAVDRLARQSTR